MAKTILAKSKNILINQEFEDTQIFYKQNKIGSMNFYGEAECATIENNEKFAVVVGMFIGVIIFRSAEGIELNHPQLFPVKNKLWETADCNDDVIIEVLSENVVKISSGSLSFQFDIYNISEEEFDTRNQQFVYANKL